MAAPFADVITGRFGPRPALVTGLAMCGTALAGLSFYGVGAHYGEYVWTLPVMELGTGLSFAPVSVSVLERVPAVKAGMASARCGTGSTIPHLRLVRPQTPHRPRPIS